MFGYDIGISGGVTSMDDFLEEFFPGVYARKHKAKEDNYCKYDNQGLQLFTSSLYLAALVSSFVASKLCTKHGRRLTMQAASVFFLAGVVLNAAARNIAMLIIGRAVPLFLSEIAPVRIRGALNILFQLDVTIGIFVANIVNYLVSNIHPWGWRLALGLAGVPATMLCLGSFVIAETPTSLIEREQLIEGLAMLKKIRGTGNVDAEHQEILHACEMARQVKQPFRNLMKRNDASLLSAVITGIVNVLSTVVSVVLVDKVGRRFLLLEACGQMLITQVNTTSHIRPACVIPYRCSDIFQPKWWLICMHAGYAFAVSSNMVFTFVIAQAFLSMMCHLRAGIFFFFAAWIVVMGLFVIFLLPETKNVPIDEMTEKVWKKHWFWKRFMDEEEEERR
ncbi:Sugar transport protein [Musa troglodytarum]|uniref:Sugar transport protein n=1 Tax=Musa troglodytarum TaxID=320322 RepID=A0A9E7EQN7_9LILI|nr:Sugar transport protein [Musa troglodytarum]